MEVIEAVRATAFFSILPAVEAHRKETAGGRRKGSMIKEKFAKLMNVKSIVTITLTGVFATLALTNRISGQEFMTIFTVVVSFYFGTQAEKRVGDGHGESENK